MSLNLGRSSNSSSQQSNAYGYNTSQSQDMSQAGSAASTTQDVFGADFFKQLFSGASGAANSALINAPELSAAARQLFTGGNQFLQSLGGGAGTDYMTQRLTDSTNPVLQAQLDTLREDSGRLFTEQINPAITARAVAGGTLGGGRQGVAQALGAGEAARAYTQGATSLLTADQGQKDQIAAQVAQNSLQSAATGLGALPGLLDVLQRGDSAELGVYSQLSGILGGPQVLSQSQSVSQSLSEAFARSFGEQRSTSSGSSRGSAWQFGGGLTPG